jgi:hypothetical protein
MKKSPKHGKSGGSKVKKAEISKSEIEHPKSEIKKWKYTTTPK